MKNTPVRPRVYLVRMFSILACAAFLAGGCQKQQTAATESEKSAPGPGVDTALGEQPPFEWMGVYTLPEGTVDLVLQPGPDVSMDIAIVPAAGTTRAALADVVQEAKRIADRSLVKVEPGTTLAPNGQFYQLQVGGTAEMRFRVSLPKAGKYALFTQHFADEFQALFQQDQAPFHAEDQRIFKERFGQIVVPPEAVTTFAVQLEPVKTHPLASSFTAPARVVFNAEKMAQVGSAVSGRIVELKARLGDTVAKGDVLIVIDSPELGEAQSDFLHDFTSIEIAAPAVELTKGEYERAKGLFDKNQGIAFTEVQKRQSEYQAAQAALRTAESATAAAKNKLRLLGMDVKEIDALAKSGAIDPRYTIRAPISGQVTRRDVTLGELIRSDKESLLVLADLRTVWVLAEVPEARLADVRLGSRATVTVAALKDEKFEGMVSYIAPELDPSTRTARVRIEVPNAAERLKPGMFAQAEIQPSGSATASAILAVPDSAVQTIDSKPVVFVPLSDRPNTYLKRPVTLESAIGAMWPVRYGLKEGDLIVTTASFLLKAELGKSSAKHDH